MDPIGLNVGGYYLTATSPDRWLADESYSWAVREATTGDSIGSVVLSPGGAVSSSGADSEGLRTAVAAVQRFSASL
ncbi:hypothetical protein P0W64_11405 [Tsukamurella sp. 8F]|uniref:hypothetical protein n=1 Tax=unclassified Tsukamurella TaxID=2633480 RepID=UPI0023BA124F|nr:MULTISPECIES: hypothetical protein [unclassified Tsukamurella]MDF0529004.1 hypothetical protein [Tsukamurella sp. 8J]MDF0587377.1 hypothetical protein [Tsukamurella sp. 8F]